MAKNNKKTELTDEQVEQILFGAMRIHGMLPPTIDEVAALDAELTSIVLPFVPTPPEELLKRLDTMNANENTNILPFPTHDTQCVSNLAHAAREGGELTEETKQQMSADKAKLLHEEKNGQ